MGLGYDWEECVKIRQYSSDEILIGWHDDAMRINLDYAKQYLQQLQQEQPESYKIPMLRNALANPAIPFEDYLKGITAPATALDNNR